MLKYTLIGRRKLSELLTRSEVAMSELRAAIEQVNRMKSGDLQSTGQSADSELLNSLDEMRQQMLRLQLEEQQRNWINVGIAEFAELIRVHQHDNALFYDKFISNLVTYLNANQGQIYVTRGDQETYLELTGCYAYNKKKYVTNRIEPGEGLVGQCFLEKEIILMTQVPENYVRITSGLGDALPRCIILVPLLSESVTVGVIELASFRKFEEFEIQFITKVAESIASAVVNIRISETTKQLLRESQLQAEQLKAQEEEMRQNMEELTASQEEMQRLQTESEAQNSIINSVAIVSKTDLRGNITYVNDAFLKWAKYSREEIIGKNHRILKSGHQPNSIFVDLWKTISSGQIWRGEVKNKAKDGTHYWVDAIIAPILDPHGKPKEYLAQRFVINEKKEKEEEMNRLLQESQAKEEELRQNMEELQAQQEELQRIQQEIEAQSNIINNVAIVSRADLRGNITYVNEEFLKWSQYSREELIGRNHRLLKSGHQPDEIFAEMWRTISSGMIWRGEVKNRAKDGSYYWVDAIIAPVLDSEGKPKEYIAQRFVINEKKEKEEKMRLLLEDAQAKEEELRQNMEEMNAQQEELQRITQEIQAQMNIINTVAIVSKTDTRGNITYVNDEFVKWSGYSRKELMGKNHRILKSGHQPDEIFSTLWGTISNGKIWRGKVKNKSKDGSFYWVDAIIAPVLDAHGKPKEYIAQRFVLEEKDVVS